MMAVLEDSIQLIRTHNKEEIDLSHLPQDDPAVYSALQRADTIGLFQVESRAQMSCLPRLKPKCFYDIVVQVAIIRPGPIVGKMVHPVFKSPTGARSRGKPASIAGIDAFAHARRATFSGTAFAHRHDCAGFSGGEAEELRRAFGFKRSEARMKDIEIKLRRGMESKRHYRRNTE